MELENIYNQFSKHLVEQLGYGKVSDVVKEFVQPYKKLMSYYTCAIVEVETKFNVLSEELSMQYDRNPIEFIRTRLKSPKSVRKKMIRKGFPLTVESIEKNLNDIARVRITCSFPSSIYALTDSLLKQDDIHLTEKKDYIKHPKVNGYRSLRLITEISIYLHDTKEVMKVEIQFRTISMNCWASLEHKIRYKKSLSQSDFIEEELVECVKMSSIIDARMENPYAMATGLIQKDSKEEKNHVQRRKLWENFHQGLKKK